jgi:hypothetical protein
MLKNQVEYSRHNKWTRVNTTEIENRKEMCSWMEQEIKNAWSYHVPNLFFSDESDAIRFKLIFWRNK